MARYSGWLAIYEHVAASLPRADRTPLAAQLAAGPRRDLRGRRRPLRAGHRRSSATAARDVYDTYLRANRVDEGVANYAVVVRLMLGAGLEDGGSRRCAERSWRYRRERIGSRSSSSVGLTGAVSLAGPQIVGADLGAVARRGSPTDVAHFRRPH